MSTTTTAHPSIATVRDMLTDALQIDLDQSPLALGMSPHGVLIGCGHSTDWSKGIAHDLADLGVTTTTFDLEDGQTFVLVSA